MPDDNNISRHEGRNDLAGEHMFTDVGQIILMVIFLAVWVGDLFFLKKTTFIAGYIPWYLRVPLGIMALIPAGYLGSRSHKTVFGTVREKPAVLCTGVYSIVRHPMYLAALLVYGGMLLFGPSIAALAVFMVIIAFYWYVARHEEKLLIAKFGDDYRQYIREVPMFIPKPWKKH